MGLSDTACGAVAHCRGIYERRVVLIYCVAKTKKAFMLHSFDSLDEFYTWLSNCVVSFGKVEISMITNDIGVMSS